MANFDQRFKPYLFEHSGETRFRRALDIGAGLVSYSPLYTEFVDEVVALDLNDFSDAYEGTGVRFVAADVTRETPFPAGHFDLVFSHSVFEHIDGVEKALAEVDRLLCRGGHAFITIRPLYFSPLGFHHREYEPWQHLSHGEPQVPDGWNGSYLNKLTMSEMLSHIGRVGWRIKDFSPRYTHHEPSSELLARYPETDLLSMEFFSLCQKVR